MKRLFTIILVLILPLVIFSGCANQTDEIVAEEVAVTKAAASDDPYLGIMADPYPGGTWDEYVQMILLVADDPDLYNLRSLDRPVWMEIMRIDVVSRMDSQGYLVEIIEQNTECFTFNMDPQAGTYEWFEDCELGYFPPFRLHVENDIMINSTYVIHYIVGEREETRLAMLYYDELYMFIPKIKLPNLPILPGRGEGEVIQLPGMPPIIIYPIR